MAKRKRSRSHSASPPAHRTDGEAADDDTSTPGSPIQDPLLAAVSLGPDREPEPGRLLKGDSEANSISAEPPRPGRATLGEAARGGPKAWLHILGPGLITGASDDDPSGIGTYSQVGSQFGLGMLWTPIFTFPLMAAVQELCARVALHTGVGLGVALRRRFPAWLIGVSILALFVANTLNVGADLGAVATGVAMLTPRHPSQIVLVVLAAALVLGLQLFVSYQLIFRVFKWLTLVLFAYVITGFIAHPPLATILLASLIPHIEFNGTFVTALVAVLGTTISPYLFFWQASSEVDEMRAAGLTREAERRGVKRSELRAARADILIGMFFSNLVMYFIILTTGAVLHAHGKTAVETGTQAAAALRPLLGSFSSVAFALGLIGTGLLAIPILSGSAAYAVKEFFGLRGSLASRPRYRPTFYAIMAVSTLSGLGMNFLHIDPIRALFYVAVINGVVAPPLVVLIVLLGSDRRVMGKRASGPLSLALTWLTAGIMTLAALAMIVSFIPGSPI